MTDEAVWTEEDQARADLIADIACEISESEDVVAMALDAYDARQWQPIETAPKEIKPVWVAHAETGVMVVGIRHKWIEGAWRNYWRDQTLSFTPTHWMPLPHPPRLQKERSE